MTTSTPHDAIVRSPRTSPLSFAQRGIWLSCQAEGNPRLYVVPAVCRVRGTIAVHAWERALGCLVQRHTVLRSVIRATDEGPVQTVLDDQSLDFQYLDLSAGGAEELGERLANEVRRPIDLENGPLFRARLFRTGENDYTLLLLLHHIITDGWSMGVLFRELGMLYDAYSTGEHSTLGELSLHYQDFARWEREQLEGEALERLLRYWRTQLDGAPARVALPTDRPCPAILSHRGGQYCFTVDAEIRTAAARIARSERATSFMVLLAAFAVWLARCSSQQDLVIGTPVANRNRTEFEGLIGCFVNTLALRVDVSDDPSFRALLYRVREMMLGANAHEALPFGLLVADLQPARTLRHSPLFQVTFSLQNTPMPERLGTAVIEPVLVESGVALFEFGMVLRETATGIAGVVRYSTDLFDATTVARMVRHFVTLLKSATADPGRRVSELSMLDAEERRLLLEQWNATAASQPAVTAVHELIEQWAERTPDAVAVTQGGEHLTYAEMNRRANRLAHALIERGVGPDTRVALCAERSAVMVVGLLAVLKAGGAYVPLDPSHPAERLRHALLDSGSVALLAHGAPPGLVAKTQVPAFELGVDTSGAGRSVATNPTCHVTPDHLAYVIYTSGSTGQPKGVMNQHRGLLNRLLWGQTVWRLEPGDSVLGQTSIGFDGSVRELLLPLSAGARIVLARSGGHREPDYLIETIRRERIGTVNLVPSLLQILMEQPGIEQCSSLRQVLCGGEPLSSALVQRCRTTLPHATLHNLYGPSEAATAAAALECAVSSALAPLGSPIRNTHIYVVSEAGEPVPVGVIGELWIGGAGVARGYVGRPGLTADRFVPDPFGREPGGRLYRTGDLARRQADGTIEFAGRTDTQVKVRGNRIELAEIEAQLARHPNVREAVVLAREDSPGDQRLVAYWVGSDAIDPHVLRSHVSEHLPDYMIPSAYVRLNAWPLTATGKVDRRALPAPDDAAYGHRGNEAPIGDTEVSLAAIWAEVLGASRIGRWDHFFELGGHSLLAVQVVSRVRQVFAAGVTLTDVFLRPVLADFADVLRTAERAELPPIATVSRGTRLPLSFAQEGLWFLTQVGDGGRAYQIPKRLRLQGDVDELALRRALNRIVARHEVLRTTFHVTDGNVEQRILAQAAGEVVRRVHDLRECPDVDAELRCLALDESETPFDLTKGPLIRARLVHLGASDSVLLVTVHHIAADGWSMRLLFNELQILYAAFRRGEPDPLPPVPLQYADYAVWQREWVERELLRTDAPYWRRQLADAPDMLKLPTDHARSADRDHAAACAPLELDEALTTSLRALSRRHGTTLFTTLLAAWFVVLSRVSGQQDLVIGTPMANRERREIEGLIGLFVNLLALRVDLTTVSTIRDLLEHVKVRTIEAQQHQGLPFARVVELVRPTRRLSHSPLFQVLFAWQSGPGSDSALPGLDVSDVESSEKRLMAWFDLVLSLSDDGERIRGGLLYPISLFRPETMARYSRYLQRVLEAMVADQGQRLDHVPLLPADERSQVLERWNATEQAYPDEACVHALFETQAARTPDAVALVHDDRVLSYAELNRSANRLARHLRERGVGPESRVAICATRSPELLVAALAVLKAGGAYVPLDPSYPIERLRYMCLDSGAATLLTQHALRGRWGTTPAIALDADAAQWADQPAQNLTGTDLTPDHLAYVIYTSGSTGQPKGVMVLHRSVVNVLTWSQARWPLGTGDAVLQRIPFSFDVSVRELFWPLTAGARCVFAVADSDTDPSGLVETIRRERVTVTDFTASMLPMLLDAPHVASCTSLSRVITGGESVSAATIAKFHEALPLATLEHEYGPTETTVAVTGQRCAGDRQNRPGQIGTSRANTRVYVLDDAGEPVPVGVVGEIYVGGVQVARGYTDRPGPTAERFIADPFSGIRGARVYRTGDLGRWLYDGGIEFVGRRDDQVKVRGYRIELGEISARLAEHPAVGEATVLAREGDSRDTQLVAYWTGDAAIELGELRSYLADRLPEYMVPAAYVRLASMPLLPGGKIDRRALPAPHGDAYVRRGFEPPVGDTETTLAGLWEEVLGVDGIGRHDHFFERGGHSLSAIRLLVRINAQTGTNMAVRDIFDAPILSALAAKIVEAQLAQFDPVELTGLQQECRAAP